MRVFVDVVAIGNGLLMSFYGVGARDSDARDSDVRERSRRRCPDLVRHLL